MRYFLICFCLIGTPAIADDTTWTPTRVIRADTTIGDGDVQPLLKGTSPMPSPIGLEARVVLYPGRPIKSDDVGPVSIVDRNDFVTLVYARGGLEISAEGRALDRGSAGQRIRVLNADSRETVFGVIDPKGRVLVVQ